MSAVSLAPERLAPRAAHKPAAAPAVVACYDVLDLCRGCGITDFTDGKYIDGRRGRRAYLAAQRRQADYLLDQIGCDLDSRILDIGCGYGRIVEMATARGAEATGITISPPQVQAGRRSGLDVQLCNYREIFTSGRRDSWEHAFDGIIANGSLEHFVQAEDAAAGRADDMYAEFFAICRRLLKPGGKLATTAIHARRVGQVNPADMLGDPARWPRGSETYHAANLHRSFGGWYPEPGQLQDAAHGEFHLATAEDGTHDYLLTSEFWMRRIKRSLALDPRSWPLAVRTFRRQPRACRDMLRCLLADESWTYQFRPQNDRPSPAQLWRHTWIAV
jgi:cyclopropane fatty-acyl-phospholipid synthase-like methyltransferase